jgi:hypothetical protein
MMPIGQARTQLKQHRGSVGEFAAAASIFFSE